MIQAILLACTLGSGAAGSAPPLAPAGAALEGPLVERDGRLLGPHRPLEEWRLLAERLAGAIAAGRFADDLARAEAEVAAILLTDIVTDIGVFEEAAAALEAMRPWPEGTPAALAFRLDHLLGEALRQIGRPGEARALFEDLGYVTDFLFIGPFDNERGSGFNVAYAPEQGFDRAAPLQGKERAVEWREMPAHSPAGTIPFEDMLNPSEHGVAYLATAIAAEGEQSVVLRIGSPCSVKVLLNGATLLAHKVDRPHFADQERVVLPLKAGWNQLLVKLAAEDKGWLAELRFTDLDGRPLQDLEVDSAQVASAAAAEPAGAAPAPAPEARQILEGMDQDAYAARLLALYHLLVHPEDVAERRARLAAERAVQFAPEHVAGYHLLAMANALRGASKVEQEVNRRLHALKKVVALDAAHVPAILDLAEFAARDNPLPDRVDELTARALALEPDSYRALTLRANLLRERGRGAEAQLLMRQAEDAPLGQVLASARADAARRLLRLGRAAEAEDLLRRELRRHCPPGRLLDDLVALLIDSGRGGEAVEITERALNADPFATGLMLDKARLFEYGGAPDAARRLCERALSVCPEHTGALSALVRMDVRAGRIAAAADRLDEVIRLDPGNEKARRQRRLISDEARDNFDDPYRWDAVTLAAAARGGDGRDEPLEMLRRTTVFKANPDGTEHRYEHVVFRALNTGGIERLDTYTIVYPEDASLQVYNVRVIHADGTFERAPAPRSRDRVSQGYRQRFFDLPPIAAGDLADVEYRLDESEPGVFGEYFGARCTFYPEVIDGAAPTRDSELIVLAPPQVPLYVAERNAAGLEKSESSDANGMKVLRWRARDLPRPALQSRMPDQEEFSPVVDVTTYADWDAFARWYWSFIEKEFVTTPEMKAKVAELTEGRSGERARVEAINRFVAQEIRYNSWPFGTHGYEPFSAATIFERRFGDCKDKSILLCQLLAEIDVAAVPVLIRTGFSRPEEPLAAAMVGHFNHCIVHVLQTAERPGYYLDGTAAHNPVGYLRADDQGAHVLHVGAAGGTIHEIPYAPPEENALCRSYVVELDASGNGAVELVDESCGSYAVLLRRLYGGEQGDIKTVLARRLNDGFGAVEIESVETSDLEDITLPAWLKARFRARGLWTAEGGQLGLRVGFDDAGVDGIASESEVERAYDVVLDRPFCQETTVLWKLPRGARVARLPPPASVEVQGVLKYTQELQETQDGVQVSRTLRLEARRIDLAGYAPFRKALREIQMAEKRTIAIEPPLATEGN